MYYAHIQGNTVLGVGQVRCLTSGIDSVEITQEQFDLISPDTRKYLYENNEFVLNPDYDTIIDAEIDATRRIQLPVKGTSKGTNPSSTLYSGIYFNDDREYSSWRENRFGGFEVEINSNGNVIASLSAVENKDATDAVSKSIKISSVSNSTFGYFDFPDTYRCDGQWVTKSLTVEGPVTFAHGDATKQFSLSSYLPNDGKEYLLLGNWNGNSADAYLEIALTSDVITANTQICRIPANSNGGSSFVFPVGTGRYIKRRANNHSSSKSTGNCYLYLMGYRRCGTNA